MQKTLLAFAAAALTIASPASAQSAQEQLDERYNRALAAGYKALFLCGAIANAERNGVNRPVDHIETMELTGVYPAIDPIVRTLEHRIVRDAALKVAHVEVDWADNMPPRFAEASGEDGCRLAPIGLEPSMPETMGSVAANMPMLPDGAPRLPPPLTTFNPVNPYKGVMQQAFDGNYGEGARTNRCRYLARRQGQFHVCARIHQLHAATHMVGRQEHCRDSGRGGGA